MEDLRVHLEKVLYNEALTKCRYEIYAEIARAEGLYYYAKILEETARNELSHVRELMRILNLCGTTDENLKIAISGERNEAEDLYPFIAKQALMEGNLDTGRFFNQVSKIEKHHKERFERLEQLLLENKVYQREVEIIWKCRVCGYIFEGKEPPQKCPGCQGKQNVFEPADFDI